MVSHLQDNHWWIYGPDKSVLPVNPTPGFLSVMMKIMMTLDPSKVASL
jgi:hypothetical protein